MADSPESMYEDLKAEIRERILFITSDCDTFINAKRQTPSLIDSWRSGGGNFLMASGLFALLNFLSKVYRQLIEPEAFVDEACRDRVRQIRREVKAAFPGQKDLHGVVDRYLRARIGDTDELRSFVMFVDALKADGIDLGIPEPSMPSAERVWRTFRNPLAHMAWTAGGTIAAYGAIEGKTLLEARAVIKSGPPAFFQKDMGAWVCNSDKLNVDVEAIDRWLAGRIDNTSADRVQGALNWIRKQEELP